MTTQDYSRKPCIKCGSEDTLLRRNITRNNVNQFFWWCQNCQFLAAGANYIPHSIIKEWQETHKLPEDLNLIPVVNDYRDGTVCSVLKCDEIGVEFHHIAPQALQEFFGDEWWAWPGVNLCKKHHDIWHSVVTFYLPGPAAPNPEVKARYSQ